MKSITVHVALDPNEKERVGDYLVGKISILSSRKSVKKAIDRGHVYINDSLACSYHYVHSGDEISYRYSLPDYAGQLGLEVAYEDDEMAVVVKPPGILSSGNGKVTVAKSLSGSLKPSTSEDALPVPLLLHRLDRDTCGLLLVAKTKSMQLYLSEQMEQRGIRKRYIAIVESHDMLPTIITDEIDGRAAITHVRSQKKLRTLDPTSLLDIELETGRTHQIRIHCAAHDCPIVGDAIYNAEGVRFGRGLFLQAYGVSWLDRNGYMQEVRIAPHKKFFKYI